MPVIDATIRIGAPPEDVVAVLLDAELAPAWTAGLERLKLIEGQPGQAGCVGHAHYLEGGRRSTLVDVLEKVNPGRYYRSRVTGGGISAVVETTLEPTADGTKLVLRWSGKGTKLLTTIGLYAMRRRIARRMETDLRALKRLVESHSQREQLRP